MKILLIGITENTLIRGVERYVIELCKGLCTEVPKLEIHLMCGDWQKYYDQLECIGVRLIKVKGLINNRLARHSFIAFGLRRYIRDYSLIHLTNTLPLLGNFDIPCVVTIHDLAEFFVPYKYPLLQRYYRRAVVWMAAKFATKIMTVSEYSAKSIVDTLGVSPSKVCWVYNGIEHFLSVKKQISSDINCPIDGAFLLHWGVLERGKGIEQLLDSFQIIESIYPYLQLVFVGRDGSSAVTVDNAVYADTKVIKLGYVTDEVLLTLICRAQAIIFPSHFEGFGFPAIEAFTVNNNIVASCTSSLGEVTREFAVQVDPSNPLDIARGIREALDKPRTFDNQLRSNILSKFSWKNCALSTYNVYCDVLSKE